MNRNRLSTIFFKDSNVLTNVFPRSGAWLLNQIIPSLFANQFLIKKYFRKDIGHLKKINKFNKILVIADLNIGDAINLQASISALRSFFPDSEINYMINQNAAPLVDGNPEISNLLPVFSGKPSPNENDYRIIEQLDLNNSYDVIFNFCPYFGNNFFPFSKNKVITFLNLALKLILNEKKN